MSSAIVSDLAAGGIFVTLLLLLALVIFDDGWAPSDGPGDAVPPTITPAGGGRSGSAVGGSEP